MIYLAYLALGWLVASSLMTGLWIIQRQTRNAGIVDVGWAAGIALLAVAYSWLGPADNMIRLAGGAMGAAWGVRLAWHIHLRSHGKPEDGRYAQLRADWGHAFQRKLFFFYQLQAITVAFFASPYLLSAWSPIPGWQTLHTVGAAVWSIGWLGEWLADAQLSAFKRGRLGSGPVCRVGLWRYSRHPNYFFEWLTWVGLSIFASSAPWGFWSFLCPAAILYLLFRVTGIPATEAQALRSKGDAYRAYQRTTSAFFPWFPRKETP